MLEVIGFVEKQNTIVKSRFYNRFSRIKVDAELENKFELQLNWGYSL